MRVNLLVTNDKETSIPLDFSTVGSLSIPVSATEVSVLKYSIPNSETPLCTWNNTRYQLLLSFDGYTVNRYVELPDRGTNGLVSTVDQVLEAINSCLEQLVLDLNDLVPVAPDQPIIVDWDKNLNLFNITAPADYLEAGPNQGAIVVPEHPLQVWMNLPMSKLFQSFPTSSKGAFDIWVSRLYFQPSSWNGTASVIVQEANSLCSWVEPRFIYIATDMPVESELFVSTSASSGQSYNHILQNSTISYVNGIPDTLTNLDFTTVTNGYRTSKISGDKLYQVRCDVFYVTNSGERKQFMLPGKQSALICLEFYNRTASTVA